MKRRAGRPKKRDRALPERECTEPMSHAEVAAVLGVTPQAVAWIEARAFAKLRRSARAKELWTLWH